MNNAIPMMGFELPASAIHDVVSERCKRIAAPHVLVTRTAVHRFT